MTDWRETCDEVIAARFSEGGKMSDGEHRDICASIAPRLARFAMKLTERIYSRPHSHREEWIARLWQESR